MYSKLVFRLGEDYIYQYINIIAGRGGDFKEKWIFFWGVRGGFSNSGKIKLFYLWTDREEFAIMEVDFGFVQEECVFERLKAGCFVWGIFLNGPEERIIY